jgi:hypothetical protein
VARLAGLVRQGGTVLDAACGTGKYWPALLAAGLQVTGVDQSAGMLAQASRKHPVSASTCRRVHLNGTPRPPSVPSMPAVPADTGPSVRADSGPCFRADSGPSVRADSGPCFRADSGPSVRADPGPCFRADSGLSVRADSGPSVPAVPADPAAESVIVVSPLIETY